MFHALGWLLVFTLFAFWSLGAWAVHSIAAWAVTNAGALAGGSATGALRLPEGLGPWIPPELAEALGSMLSALTPAIESLVAGVPALASGLSVVIWVVWAIGSALLVALGLVLSGTIAVMRRRSSAQVGTPAAALR